MVRLAPVRPVLSYLMALASSVALASAVAACGAADDPVVAQWRDVSVRMERFVSEYRRFATFAPVRDGLEARRDYARRMVERAIVVRAARVARLDTLDGVRAYVERAVDMAMRRVWLESGIGSTIPEATEAEIRDAFLRSNTRLRLQQVYAATEEEAIAAAGQLAEGVPFDSLAARSMRSAGVPVDSLPGDMGWVTFLDLDEGPEGAAFSLRRGEVSSPVRSLQGWHIFRLVDREETVRVDATAFDAARERLAFEVRQRRFDEASARRIRELVVGRELATDLRVLEETWSAVFPALQAFDPSGPALELDLQLAETRDRGLDPATVVARVDGHAFTVGRLLRGLPDVPRSLWNDPRAALEVAIRDSLVAAEAGDAGFADHADVLARRETAGDEILYQAMLFAVADTIDLERVARTFYDDYRDRYFVAGHVSTYERLAYPDSAAARTALAGLLRGESPAVETRTVSENSQRPSIPAAHRLAPRSGWSGPYPTTEGSWALVSVLDRTPEYVPRDSVDVRPWLESSLFEVMHRESLDRTYDPSEVTFNDEALMAALPSRITP